MEKFKHLIAAGLQGLLAMAGLCLPNASNDYIDQSGDAGYFNINYVKQAEANINDNFPLLMMMEKLFDSSRDTHDGLRSEIPVELTYSGGVSWGSIGTARSSKISKAQIDHKDLFAVAYADAKTVSLTRRNQKVSYGSIMDFEVKTKIMNFRRQIEIALFGNGNGSLGTIDGSQPTGSAAAPVIVISQSTWCPYRWELKDIVNIGSATDNYEVTAVNPTTRAVTLSRLDGSVDLTSTTHSDVVYLQNSKDNAWHGLREICDATSSTLYGLDVGRRWQAEQYTATGGLTPTMMRARAMNIRNLTGEFPDLINASSKQFQQVMVYADQLQQIHVDAKAPKRYNEDGNLEESADNPYYAGLGFEAVGIAVPGATIPIVDSRFIEDDRVYFNNTKRMMLKLTDDGFHWLRQGNDIWLRVSGSKLYEAVYYATGNVFFNPAFQGVVSGLA